MGWCRRGAGSNPGNFLALVPGGESAVTVTTDAPLTTEAVAAALDEAGAYHLSGHGDEDGAFIAPARTLPLV